MDIKRKNDGSTVVSECTQTFNRFGVKKQIVFEADNASEASLFSRSNSGRTVRMIREEYAELPDAKI